MGKASAKDLDNAEAMHDIDCAVHCDRPGVIPCDCGAAKYIPGRWKVGWGPDFIDVTEIMPDGKYETVAKFPIPEVSVGKSTDPMRLERQERRAARIVTVIKAFEGMAEIPDGLCVQEMLDVLRQWAWAEVNNDNQELENARSSRNAILAKFKGDSS